MAKSLVAFIFFSLLFGAFFLLMNIMIFNARGLPLIYHAL